jgi:endonuclease I
MFTNQCGTYSSENECYNHEHTWPSTFFNDATPMRTDLFHVMPTDGYVNNKRSNYPYGKVNSSNWTSQNGSKLGSTSTYAGYGDKAFEPIDSFKGDVARNFFYMSTRYENEDGGWGNWTMANGANLTTDAITLLLAWHHLDPVSQKEIDRNNAVYAIQGNRNPFIDYPIFADCIWGVSDCAGVGITQNDVQQEFDVYPNPSTNTIYIQCKSITPSRIEVINIFGEKIINQDYTSHQINITDLAAGNYCIIIQTEQGLVKKLFVKK